MAVFSQMTHPSCKMFLNFKKSRTTMFLQMMFLICSVCNTYGAASTASPSCASDEYRAGNFCCFACPAGYRVGRDCTATANSLCSKCPDGTFKEGLSGQKQCSACTRCVTGQKVKKKCTPTSDAVCEILDGFFCSDSADKDTFSEATLSCQPHTMCDSGVQIKPGTDSTDSTCIKYVAIVFIIIGCITFISVLGALVYRRHQKTREESRNRQDAADSAAMTRYGDIRKVETSGASIQTAQQDRLKITGVAASHELAKIDAGRMERYRPIINNVAKKQAVDPAVIAAIISRASRAGNVIFNSNPPGWGDNNMSFGLMQINVDPEGGNHKAKGGWDSEEHLDQATGILVYFIQQIQYNRPRWTKEQQLKGGIAAYFEGVEGVISYEPEDEPTKGNEYSNDVVARAQLYKSLEF